MKIKIFIFLFSLMFFSFWAPFFVNANYTCTTLLPDGSKVSNCSTTNITNSDSTYTTTCEETECYISPPVDFFCISSVLVVPFMSMDMYYCKDSSDTPDFTQYNWSAACRQEAEMFYSNYTPSCERNMTRWPAVSGQLYEMRCCFTLNPTACTVDSDCPSDGNECTQESCSGGTCLAPTNKPAGTACTNGTCDGAGACTPTSPPTNPTECQVTTDPPSLDLLSGQNLVSANVTGLGSATINQMRFGVYENPPGAIIATVDPISDSDSPYFTRVSPVINDDATWVTGTTAVWATADLSDGRTCQSSGITDTDISISAVISVKVFNDDGDGEQETGEIGTAGATITLTQPNESQPAESRTINAGSSGSVAFLRIPGNYTLTVTVPSGYTISNSGSQVASMIINNLSQNMTYSFPVVPSLPGSGTPTPTPSFSADCSWDRNDGKPCKTVDGWGTCNWNSNNCDIPLYSISGKLFLDNYEDTQSTGDDKYTNSVAVTVKKGEETFAVTPSGGTYTANNLPAGDYTIKFSGLPEGWRFTYPNTPDNSLQVQVGPTCEYPTTTSEASCRP